MNSRYFLIIIACLLLVLCAYHEESSQTVQSDKVERVVAMTFDDGPHPIYTLQLLDGLRKRDVKVTFFLIGKSIDGNEEVVKQMYQDGHLIGNHGHDHILFTQEHEDQICLEVNKTNQKILDITGEMPTYIRPPFGKWSDELDCIIPMTVVLWNVDTLDWRTQNKNQIVQDALKKIDHDNIILMHDVYESSVEAALELIDILIERGYTFVTVEDLMVE